MYALVGIVRPVAEQLQDRLPLDVPGRIAETLLSLATRMVSQRRTAYGLPQDGAGKEIIMKRITIAGARHALAGWLALGSVCAMGMVLSSAVQAQSIPPEIRSDNVTINAVRLTDARVSALEQQYRMHIPDGDYWYDSISGAWGLQGGPTLGFTLPGLDLGGPLRADASGGNTGVFVNGRELHWLDVVALEQLLQLPIPQGRYWLDAYGNAGYEDGLFLFNLVLRARAVGARAGGAWSHSSLTTDAHVGGDGQGFLFYIDRDSSVAIG
jgi:hypothetical protein